MTLDTASSKCLLQTALIKTGSQHLYSKKVYISYIKKMRKVKLRNKECAFLMLVQGGWEYHQNTIRYTEWTRVFVKYCASAKAKAYQEILQYLHFLLSRCVLFLSTEQERATLIKMKNEKKQIELSPVTDGWYSEQWRSSAKTKRLFMIIMLIKL